MTSKQQSLSSIFKSAKYAGNVSMKEFECSFKTVDVAKMLELKSEIIKSVIPRIVNNGVEIEFVFNNGKIVIFSSINDVSNYRT